MSTKSSDRAKTIPFTPPMECLPVKRLPEGPEWAYELKLDGFRAQAIRDSKGVRLLSRNGKDFSKKHPGVFAALKDAIPEQTVVDGELVAFGADGQPSFNELQNADSNTNIVFFTFDALMVGGKDVKPLPLRDRVSILQSAFISSDRIRRSEQFTCGVQPILSAVRKIGGEGVIAKRLDSRYEPGKRSGSWQNAYQPRARIRHRRIHPGERWLRRRLSGSMKADLCSTARECAQVSFRHRCAKSTRSWYR
jgi:ATP-dependent DNA ligase